MAELIFKAFMSCSFAEHDEAIINFFKELIWSFDIEPQVYDYQEIGRIPDKLKEEIVRSDCLIAIATRRKKIEGSNGLLPKNWAIHNVNFSGW